MKWIIASLGVCLCARLCLGATINVPSDQPTIQSGIDAAVNGDTVLVADGIFSGNGNRDLQLRSKAITLMSENGPEQTIIDCQQAGHRGFWLNEYETHETLIKGFTVKNASATGGGIYLYHSSPTIVNCVVKNNTTGGMMCSQQASPILDSVVFIDNVWFGLRIGGASAEVRNCEFRQPSKLGRGLVCDNSDPVYLEKCIFDGNTGEYGGAIWAWSGANLILSECLFYNNTADYEGGGAVYLGPYDCSLEMDGCTFQYNRSVYWCSVLYAVAGQVKATNCTFEYNMNEREAPVIFLDDGCSDIVFTGCTFRVNRGLVMWCRFSGATVFDSCLITNNHSVAVTLYFDASPPTFLNCTFAYNSIYDGMGAVLSCNDSPPTIENTIIAFNNDAYPLSSGGDAPFLGCCDIYGNAGGDWVGSIADQYGISGNISLDPEFCLVNCGNFHVLETSPCAPDNNECAAQIGAFGADCEYYLCGDADASGALDIDDVVYLINNVFASGPEPVPGDAGDVDCSCRLDIDDIVLLISYIFVGDSEPCVECPWHGKRR